MLFLGLPACAEQSQRLPPSVCEIVGTVLPEGSASSDFSHVTSYVSEHIAASEGPDTLHETIEGGFSEWRVRTQCEDVRLPADGCVEQVAQHELNIEHWPDDAAAYSLGSLRDCGSVDFGPEITAASWHALFKPDGLPNVSSIYLYSINQVVISLDRKRAIVTMEYTCGGLCGEGYSLLLEREVGGWKVIGKQTHWVS